VVKVLPQRQACTPTYCPQFAPRPRAADVAGIDCTFVMQSLFSVKPFLALFLPITHSELCNIGLPRMDGDRLRDQASLNIQPWEWPGDQAYWCNLARHQNPHFP